MSVLWWRRKAHVGSIFPVFRGSCGFPTLTLQNLQVGMCCVLKVAARRVILKGEHAKVALNFHLHLWDFEWMSGSSTVLWGGEEGELFL